MEKKPQLRKIKTNEDNRGSMFSPQNKEFDDDGSNFSETSFSDDSHTQLLEKKSELPYEYSQYSTQRPGKEKFDLYDFQARTSFIIFFACRQKNCVQEKIFRMIFAVLLHKT